MSDPERVNLLIRNAHVVDPAQGLDGRMNVAIRDGVLEGVAEGLDCVDLPELDGDRLIVTPALVDIHVHLRVPGQEHKENFLSGAAAAAAGGIGHMLCMPNTVPAIDNPELVRTVLERAAEESPYVAIGVVGAATVGNRCKELTDFPGLRAAGCLGVTDDAFAIQDEELLRQALAEAAQHELVFVNHAELYEMTADGIVHDGWISSRLGLPGIPAEAETLAIERNAALAHECGATIHFMHLSAGESVARVREAKARGWRLTAEVTPHHLALTEESVVAQGPNAKMNPPLRSAEDREALRHGLADGTIDVIATDHAPHAPHEKRRGLVEAPFGVIGLETAMAVSYTELVSTGLLSLRDLVARMTTRPAEVMGLTPSSLVVGQQAHLAVFERGEFVIDETWLRSMSQNTPFIGYRTNLRPLNTILRGQYRYRRPLATEERGSE